MVSPYDQCYQFFFSLEAFAQGLQQNIIQDHVPQGLNTLSTSLNMEDCWLCYDGLIKVPYFMQYSLNSFYCASLMPNAVNTLSFFNSSEAFVVPSCTRQSTWMFKTAFLISQPFLHICSLFASALHTSHFNSILMNQVSTINPKTLIRYLTIWSVGMVLMRLIVFLAWKSVSSSLTIPITLKTFVLNCSYVQMSI